jgi:hypothetical protein
VQFRCRHLPDTPRQERLAALPELAEAEWQKIKPRADDKGYDAHRSAITRIMERLAEASGDVDELVAIKAKDLSSSYRYLGIAEILAKAKRHDEAAGVGRARPEGLSGSSA